MPQHRPLHGRCAIVCAAAVTASLVAALPAFAQSSPPARAQASKPAGPASLSASAPDDCAKLRKDYLDSQACFERYRNTNATMQAEGFKRCREVVDPSPRCGPNLPTR